MAMPQPDDGARPAKIVTESVRERETFKYDAFLSSSFRYNNTGQLLPASEISTSPDSILTALAQLGVHQTGTERCFISLFDTTHQYILAEATPSTPLTPGVLNGDCETPLVQCGTAIPRSHGLCEAALYAPTAAGEPDQLQGPAVLPLTLVDDLAKDPRFSCKLYCQLGGGGRFFAAVPIRTRRGINIGVMSVLSKTRPAGWDDRCVRRMKEISYAAVQHLEISRLRHSYRRNERKNRGLGSFMEGKSTISGWRSAPDPDPFLDQISPETTQETKQQVLERHERECRDEETQHQAAALASRPLELSSSTPAEEPAPKIGFSRSLRDAVSPHVKVGDSSRDEARDLGENRPSHVFSKAANIIREAFEVEGCLFFDVTLGSYRVPRVRSPAEELEAPDMDIQQSSTSSSDDLAPATPAEPFGPSCDLLGFSTLASSSIKGDQPNATNAVLPQAFLAKLLRRYPDGKIFNFDAVGELQSSDSSEDDDGHTSRPSHGKALGTQERANGEVSSAARKRGGGKRFGRLEEGSLIQQAFPGARSVAFMPAWDSRRDRWLAGGFVYTLTPTQVFTMDGELGFLRAFAKLAAAEVLHVETLQADKAKSDALGSLSHELRSPLHGVILGTELLNDTELSVFQGNATHTIETCCRTLLDTIDHLLDYTKVNSLTAKRKQAVSAAAPTLRKRAKSDHFFKKTLYTDARLDGLIEEVAESIFAGFNFQHKAIKQFTKTGLRPTDPDITAQARLDSARALEQLGPILKNRREQRLELGDVSVYLSIDPTCNWMFNLPAGAIRRIFMNLFGNALKYTAKGTIRVSLSQETTSSRRLGSDRKVKLIVQDTGKGISEEYLRHKLFKPFAQEDELAAGTGLGLSLVKKMTSQLRGRIYVESQVGVGTTVTVTLPLEPSPQKPGAPALELPEDDQEFEDQVKELKGLRVRISGFAHHDSGSRGAGLDGRTVLEEICRGWLHMELVSDDQGQQTAPDVVLWSNDALPKSFEQISQLDKTPNVVVCANALTAYQRATGYESAGHGAIFEFISQPIGPRKIARSISCAYKRWMSHPKSTPPPRPRGPYRSRSSGFDQLPTQRSLQQMPRFGSVRDLEIRPSKPADADIAPSPRVESTSPPAYSDEETPPEIAPTAIINNKILLVDDNPINLKVLSAYMEKLGQAYEVVTNGKEAVDTYMENPSLFAGILMDISMPVMNGLEATRHIRAYEHKAQQGAVAILTLTGLASDSVQQEAAESGVDVFLTKPVRLKVLREVLESMNILPPLQADGA